VNVCVVGLWHLGCVTATCLADLGLNVTGFDTDEETVYKLKNGYMPIYEPGLEDLVLKHNGCNLFFTSDVELALSNADYIWVTYDTPVDENDIADVAFVVDSVLKLFPYIRRKVGIIISSQLPVRTSRELQQTYIKSKYPHKAAFAYSPENLRLGHAIEVFLHPDRIVIGTDEHDKKLFEPLLNKISDNIEWMSIESAEMTKHAINAFLATSATFANEIASLCEFVSANAHQVARGLKTESRIGKKAYVAPGPAIAGGTLKRDIQFLSRLSDEFTFPATLIQGVLESNERHRYWVIERLRQEIGDLSGKTIGVLGLAYKPGTNTLRRSLSIELCKTLADSGVYVKAFDPQINELSSPYNCYIKLCNDINDLFYEIDALVVSTECKEFLDCLRTENIKKMQGKVVVDPNGFLSSDASRCQNQIHYISFGGSTKI